MRLVTKGSAGASHEISIVLGNALLAAPDAPADNGDTAEKDGTADTSNNAANDLLGAGAQSTTVAAVSIIVVDARYASKRGL